MYIYLFFAHLNSLWRKSSQTFSILSLSLFAFAMDKRKRTGWLLLVNVYLVKECCWAKSFINWMRFLHFSTTKLPYPLRINVLINYNCDQWQVITVIHFDEPMWSMFSNVDPAYSWPFSQISLFRLASKNDGAKEIVVYTSFLKFKLPPQDVDTISHLCRWPLFLY